MSDDNGVHFEDPPPARGGTPRTDWSEHVQPLVRNPRRWGRVRLFRETSPAYYVKPAEDDSGGEVYQVRERPGNKTLATYSSYETAAHDVAGRPQRTVFDKAKSNSRAGTLASGIRDSNKGKPGSLRLPPGNWHAMSRANGVWAIYFPEGHAIPPHVLAGEPYDPELEAKELAVATAGDSSWVDPAAVDDPAADALGEDADEDVSWDLG